MNAVLAGQLWPQPVLDFYLDHLVLEGGDSDEDKDIEYGSEDWMQQIVEGLDLLDTGYKVTSDISIITYIGLENSMELECRGQTQKQLI